MFYSKWGCVLTKNAKPSESAKKTHKTQDNSKNGTNKNKLTTKTKSIVIICIIAFLILVAVAVPVLLGGGSEPVPDSSAFGNTPTNTANGGMVVDVGELTYYSNNGIYIKPAGGDAYALSTDRAQSLAYMGGYLYYCNISDNNRCYRINVESGISEKITDFSVEYINIVDNEIYFLCNKELETCGIYKMGLSGENLEKISDVFASSLLAYQGRLYYTDKDMSGSLYYMSYAGDAVTRITKGMTYCPVISEENLRLYYSTAKGVYSSKLDGSSAKRLSSKSATCIAFYEQTLILSRFSYSDQNGSGIFSTGLGMTNIKKIRDDEVLYISVGKGKLYFESISSGFAVIRCDIDGENGIYAAGGESTGALN